MHPPSAIGIGRRRVHLTPLDCVIRLACTVAFLAGLSIPSAVSAQVVQGRLLDASDGTSLGTAMITLVDRDDREVGRVLTRSNSGLFQLNAPAPGEYRLRAERIGYATSHSDFFSLAVGDTLALDIRARVEAISLRGIEAVADRQCRVRPGEGLAVSRVWEEARKALEAAAWTQERGLYRYYVLRIKRRLDRSERRVESEDRTYEQGFGEAPYVSLPADSLLTVGFARYSPDESVFWAPDAEVLLSDDFLDTHCFQIRQGGDAIAGVVGLGFEPVPDRPVTEISGTIWLDQSTSQLRWLEFQYENLDAPRSLVEAAPGGRGDFHALPNGTWIVSSWSLRMFRARVDVDTAADPAAATLDGITIEHGNVLQVQGDEGVVFEGDPGGRIAGTVFDSSGVGLPGAHVFIEGSGAEVVTDAEGRFELAHLGPRTYTLHFTHPHLQQFGYRSEPTEVRVEEGAVAPTRVDFEAPALAQVIHEICRGVEQPTAPLFSGTTLVWRNAILTGRVTSEAGKPVDGTSVRVYTTTSEFEDVVASIDALSFTTEWRTLAMAPTNSSGFYGVCWLPVDESLMVVALDEEEEINPNDVGQVLGLADLFPGSVRLVTIPREAPYQQLDIVITSR